MLEAIRPRLDAIEAFNARTIQPKYNKKASAFAAAHGLPVTAGSDAHTAMEIGAAYLEMPAFTTAEEFRANLPQATIHGKLSPPWIHFFSRLNTWRGQFGLKPVIDPQ
jgi:predicted metal-dependent phosphoesterase TrpH